MLETLDAGDTTVPVSPEAHETPQDPLSHEVDKLVRLIRFATKRCGPSGVKGALASFERAVQRGENGHLKRAARDLAAQASQAGRREAPGVVGRTTQLTRTLAKKLTAQD